MIVVAGGSGRLGTELVRRLAARGLPVRVLTRERARAAHLLGESHVEVVEGDVRDRAGLIEAVAGADVAVSAVHGLAGPGRVSPASVDRDGNAKLVAAAAEAGAAIVLVSIAGAAADSEMELFRMKHAAERHLEASGVEGTVVRATAFLELWIDLLEASAARSGRPVVFGRGENPINFVSVRDVAALVEIAVTDSATRGATLTIGGPENLTFNELAAALQRAAGRRGGPLHVPPAVLRLMAQTVGRIKPGLGRQLRAALAMDRVDLTFDSAPTRAAYPDLPATSLADLLALRSKAPRGARVAAAG